MNFAMKRIEINSLLQCCKKIKLLMSPTATVMLRANSTVTNMIPAIMATTKIVTKKAGH